MLSQRYWTVDDMAELPDDGLRYEALDGRLVMTPPPVARHQEVAVRLLLQLRSQCTREWLVLPSQAVRLETDWRVPDLLIVPSSLPWDDGLYEPADVALVIEVVSAGSRRLDRVVKPAEYAAAGIPRFWRVETDPWVELASFTLEDGVYVPGAPTAPFPVTIDVGALRPERDVP
jgi:Uma2 family endonuclease